MARLILTHEIAKRLVAICDDHSHYKVTHDGVPINFVVYSYDSIMINDAGGKFRYTIGDSIQISVYERQDDYFS